MHASFRGSLAGLPDTFHCQRRPSIWIYTKAIPNLLLPFELIYFSSLSKHMLRNILFFSFFVVGCLISSWAQTGKLTGKVLDQDGNPINAATVIVREGNLVRYGAQTDPEGFFSINPVDPGTYLVEARYLGGSVALEDVPVLSGQTRDIELQFFGGLGVDTVNIYVERPFEKDPIVGTSLNNKEIQAAGTRNIESLASLTAGVFQSDEGNQLLIRGARSSSTVYYVDGVKLRGTTTLPQQGIADLQVITGGTPAEFGDFTGGVINVITASPAAEFNGTLEAVTSEYLDGFGRNLVGLTLSGPLLTKRSYFEGTQQDYRTSLLGFFLTAELDYNRDADPAATGIFGLRDGLLDSLTLNPLRISEDNIAFRNNGNYIKNDDIVPLKVKPNNEDLRLRGLVRLDFQPKDNILVKFGGNYEFINSDSYSIANSLFSPDPRSKFQGNLYRGYARFQQNFRSGPSSTIRNLFYSIQADYTRYERRFWHEDFRENYWDYGYVGQFFYDEVPIYGRFNDGSFPSNNYDPFDPISSGPYYQTVQYALSNLRFDGTNSRLPVYANYNEQLLAYVRENGIQNIQPAFINPNAEAFEVENLDELLFRGGVRNGDYAGAVYSLFNPVGHQARGYTKFDYDQFRLTGQATAEIGGHNIKAGFEFEQRIERFWSVGAAGLWPLARQYTNFHLLNLDDDPNSFIYQLNEAGEWTDTILVPRRYVGDDQRVFDRNLRERVLGLPVDGTDWINIDALTPEQLSLDLFTADELWNNGNGPINYYGYSYLGDNQETVPYARFFDEKDEDGNNTRPISPFSPTYISAFIQDKFEFEDIIFNIGLRVDRFDANQPVLRDAFSLFPFFNAGEVATGNIGNVEGFSLPAGIGNDYVPYVDSNIPQGFSRIVGYRNGEQWFDENGAPISSAEIARRTPGGRPIPALQQDTLSEASFVDYTPQITPMPRISFSFPITDQAQFFAHYDWLVQRPGQINPAAGSLLAGSVADYFFLINNPTNTVTNPNLKPEITVDYEAGFKQRLGDFVGLTLSAYLRQQRNMVTLRRFTNAYPFSYDSYDNLDFGTIKGFQFSFDMRRVNNVKLRASYTLQFANATGSSFNSSRNIANFLEGEGVLRTLFPVDFDQRHRITTYLDYRFIGRSLGPGLRIGKKTIYPLKNFGFNITGNLGSGTPFSRNAVVTPSVSSGQNIVNQLSGSPNGSRRPWTYRLDFRADKQFGFGGKRKADGTRSRAYSLNVYLTILNLLDTRNVIGVYRFTGLPDDDGYLTSDIGRQDILIQIDPEAFVDQYRVRLENPNNFSLPRRIRAGFLFNF